MRLSIPIICATITLSGCGPLVPIQTLDKTGIDTLLTASKLPVISQAAAIKMQDLGEITGYSCMNQATEPAATKAGAIDQVKIIAVQQGATAITEPICEEGGVSLLSNCWHSWGCKAKAFR